MVPVDDNTRLLGTPMPNDGTARGDECVVCGRRFSNRYYIGGSGPFCGEHVPPDKDIRR